MGDVAPATAGRLAGQCQTQQRGATSDLTAPLDRFVLNAQLIKIEISGQTSQQRRKFIGGGEAVFGIGHTNQTVRAELRLF